MNTKFVGTKELRQNMAKITNEAQRKNERIIVLRKNKPLFELRPLSNKDSLVESFRNEINIAQEQVKKGQVYSESDVLNSLGL